MRDTLKVDDAYYISHQTDYSAFADAMQDVGPSPCEKFKCDNTNECATLGVECKAFRVWTNQGEGVYERHLNMDKFGNPKEKPIENSIKSLLQICK